MKCPNCKSTNVWLEKTDTKDWIRCRCGLMKMVEHRDGGIIIRHRTSADMVCLPKKDTQLHKALMVVASFGDQRTDEVAMILDVKPDKMATTLKMLDTSGLLVVLENRRGKQGGSVWGLSKAAHRLLGDK